MMQMTPEDRKILRDAADISQRKKTLRQIADENNAKMKTGKPRKFPLTAKTSDEASA
jgi:hypothetical protein